MVQPITKPRMPRPMTKSEAAAAWAQLQDRRQLTADELNRRGYFAAAQARRERDMVWFGLDGYR